MALVVEDALLVGDAVEDRDVPPPLVEKGGEGIEVEALGRGDPVVLHISSPNSIAQFTCSSAACTHRPPSTLGGNRM